MTEFYDERIEQLQREIADKYDYDIEEHSLVLYVRPKKKPTREPSGRLDRSSRPRAPACAP